MTVEEYEGQGSGSGTGGNGDPPAKGEKVLLIVQFDGKSVKFNLSKTAPLKKIFRATEKQFGMEPMTLKFTFDGKTLNDEDSPLEHEMEDEDLIHAHTPQIGGSY
ncbi:ubiquitin-like protein [Clavulina sp. PMI_390]|nr:ubiquitin-like protein [Clavulina sp. PMI_390]